MLDFEKFLRRRIPSWGAIALAAASVLHPMSVRAETPLKVRIVFVNFPNSGLPDTEPVWADDFAKSFSNYIAFVSNGRQIPDVAVLHRPDAPGSTWVTPQSLDYYRSLADPDTYHQYINADMITTIHAALAAEGAVWSGVDDVMFLYCKWVFGSAKAISYTPPKFDLPPGFPRGTYQFNAGSITAMLYTQGSYPAEQLSPTVPLRIESDLTHEFGHFLFGTFARQLGTSWGEHSPNTGGDLTGSMCDSPGTSWVNYGRYDLMSLLRPVTEGDPGFNQAYPGYVAYHPEYLIARGWLPVEDVYLSSGATLPLRIPDSRDPVRAKAVRVHVPGSPQYFLLVNHQGTGFDVKYGGTGLLIWHIARALPEAVAADAQSNVGSIDWDLESAAGKTVPPAGETGYPSGRWCDPLEADQFHMGSSADFFNGPPHTTFDEHSNPDSKLYASMVHRDGQPTSSGVSIINIRRDTESKDMLADAVYAPTGPTATMPYPAAGTPVRAGDVLVARWTLVSAKIDLLRSDATGATWTTLLSNVDNLGEYAYTIPAGTPVGSGYRFRVQASGTPATAIESAAFTVWSLSAVSGFVAERACNGQMRVRCTWTTSIPVAGSYVLLTPPGADTPIAGAFDPVLRTAHEVDVWTPCSMGSWALRGLATIEANLALPTGPSPWRSGEDVSATMAVTTCSCGGGGKGGPEFGLDRVSIASDDGRGGAVAIRFSVPVRGSTRLAVMDVQGREVRKLVDDTLSPGTYDYTWDRTSTNGARSHAGVYFLVLTSEGKRSVKRLVLGS